MRELTTIEKICIQAATVQTPPDWQTLFYICHPNSTAKHAAAIVSRWKNNPAIMDYYNRTREEQQRRIFKEIDRAREEERRRIEAEQRTQAGQGPGLIDYSDPQQQRRKLNELVNGAEDSREALDALKTIIATQKDDRDAARERKQVQTYLPARCLSCPLYDEKKKSL